MTGRGRHRLRAPPGRTGLREHSGAGISKRSGPEPEDAGQKRADSRYIRCTRYVHREGSWKRRAVCCGTRSQCGWYRGKCLNLIPSRNAVTVFRGVFYLWTRQPAYVHGKENQPEPKSSLRGHLKYRCQVLITRRECHGICKRS